MPKKISELIEPYKSMAISHKAKLGTKYKEFDGLTCFDWQQTVEGCDFWDKVFDAVTEIDYPPVDIFEPKDRIDTINPDYYKTNTFEVIDMMVSIWGKDAVIDHCEMCAFKYRMRLGNKPNNSVDDDLGKAKWYESKANELKTK